ncbi:hypothetical protein T484DRAFT_1963930 [Baffinella frigidus]|nr:hypothetical protein T484DRAFT_1963930 [Cryptophyta sp. CCMP2293]
MCICGFVCIPLIAFFGAGIAGVGAPALIAEAERAKKAEAGQNHAKGEGGGEGGSEALQELCDGSNGGKKIPKSAEGICFLCYGMEGECDCESEIEGNGAEDAGSSPAAKGPCELCYADACGCKTPMTL